MTVVTQEELSLVRSYLFLLFIQKVFERDSNILEESGLLKTPGLYVELVHAGADRTGILMSEVKHEFRKRSIAVLEIHQDERLIRAVYEAHGEQHELSIPMSEFRMEMYERMRAYLGLSTSLPTTSSFTGTSPLSPAPPVQSGSLTGRRKRLVKQPSYSASSWKRPAAAQA